MLFSADPAALPITRARLHAELLTGRTVTKILQELTGQTVTVRRQAGASRAIPPAGLARLGAAAGEAVAFRRIHLLVGGVEAGIGELWYRPACLTEAMRQALAQTDQPYGGVIAPLEPRRETLAARLCGAEEAWALEVSAVVMGQAGQALAYVEERFSAAFAP